MVCRIISRFLPAPKGSTLSGSIFGDWRGCLPLGFTQGYSRYSPLGNYGTQKKSTESHGRLTGKDALRTESFTLEGHSVQRTLPTVEA